ncbi:MAG: acetylornithine deacetylase [Paracoccaceae bacterium]
MTTVDILEKLVGFETVSAQSNLALIEFVQELLTARGFRVSRLPSPCGAKAGLYAEIGPEVDGGLLLSSHTDVVPVEGQDWTRPPFRLTTEGDKLFGRGTTDMKGFLSSALSLAVTVKSQNLQRPLAIVLSYDEEIGCLGLQNMQSKLAPLIRAPSLCIVGEPTEMQVAIGHKGKTSYKATFKGKAGHSALAPKFDNALHFAADFMSGLRSMQSRFAEIGPFDTDYEVPYTTVHVGKFWGGTALNIVPDRAEMLFEARHLAQQNSEELREELDALQKSFGSGVATPRMVLETTNTYPGFEIDPDHGLVTKLVRLTGTQRTKVAFGTEAGILAEMGVPTLVCGPGSMAGQGHKADEFILKQQLQACDDLLAKLLVSICSL